MNSDDLSVSSVAENEVRHELAQIEEAKELIRRRVECVKEILTILIEKGGI